jgi:hypothetical protein
MHASGGADSTSFDITNSCAYTVRAVISPGAGAAAALDSTGFVLAPGESRAVPVPSSVWSGRLWGRCTDCGSADSCQDCAGGNAAPPVTLVEFSIDGSRGIDLYDISVVDGYNLPVLVEPRGAAAPGPGGRCAPAACVLDLDSECPAELRVPSSSAGTGAAAVACQSACLAFGTPQYCCTGAYGSADTCRPSAYSDVFKRACPQAVSYAYDADSVFTCRAGETGVSYTVTFCPASTSRYIYIRTYMRPCMPCPSSPGNKLVRPPDGGVRKCDKLEPGIGAWVLAERSRRGRARILGL